MAIRAVSSVNFNNYNNISFESRRKKIHSEYSGYSTSPLKVVPLAALIAMSPIADTYANEPYINNSAYVQGLEAAQQYGKVPLPSHFSFINRFVVDMPNGDKLGLYFIDTDQNKVNYEMFEYIHIDKDSNPIARGIIKRINLRNNEFGKSVVLFGIKLSTTDSKDYAPRGEIRDFVKSDDLYNFFNRIIDESSNNGSISRIAKSAYNSTGSNDDYVREYKKALGLIK